MIVMSTLSTALVILFASLRKKLKEFIFSYSVLEENNIKTTITFSSDKSYKIEQCKDNGSGIQTPTLLYEGILNNKQYKQIRKLLQKNNFFKMNDTYGSNDLHNKEIMSNITFITKGKEKVISIRNSEHVRFSHSFLNLLNYLNDFLQNYSDNSL